MLPLSHSSHVGPQSSHLGLSTASSVTANTSNQQELQAKILSLFNSGSGASGGSSVSAVPQSQAYGSLGPSSAQNPPRQAMPGPPLSASQGYMAPPGRMPLTQRPPSSTAGINFDNPSVQKALDTLIQSGPPLPLVSAVAAAASQQQSSRQAPGMSQAPPMSMYPQQY